MDYYVGNGIYDYLSEHEYGENFYWTSGDMWILVYGNEDREPKVVTVASQNLLADKITEEEKKAVSIAKEITAGTDVAVNFIRFAPGKSIEKVLYWKPGMKKISEISSDDLKNQFAEYGLVVNQRGAQKSINDKSSSPYHDWQRANLGDSVVVADIDLLRFESGAPKEIIELKRSYKTLEEWKPYKQDYKNFFLLSKLARKKQLEFYIVYNRRTTQPFFDDVSKLKIFEFDHRKEPCCSLLGCRSTEQFANSMTGDE